MTKEGRALAAAARSSAHRAACARFAEAPLDLDCFNGVMASFVPYYLSAEKAGLTDIVGGLRVKKKKNGDEDGAEDPEKLSFQVRASSHVQPGGEGRY